MSRDEIQSLIKQYDSDILYDCHLLQTRVYRSEARKQLVGLGAGALQHIITHLKKNMPIGDVELTYAWCTLLNHIEISIDLSRSGPQRLDDIEGWVQWAQRFADSKERIGV